MPQPFYQCILFFLLFYISFASRDPIINYNIQVITSNHILVLSGTAAPSSGTEAWTVQSDDDPAYSSPIPPEEATISTRASALIPEGWPYDSVLEYHTILAVATNLIDGATYNVEGTLENGTVLTWEYNFDPANTWTPSLKTNQVGYRQTVLGTEDFINKYAYVSYWLIDLDPFELTTNQRAFSLIEADSGDIMFDGELSLRLAYDSGTDDAYGSNYALANVYEADFSEATVEDGYYYIFWSGVGRSWPFYIGDSVYDSPFKLVFHELYQQRCGTALLEEYTDWPHEKCHDQNVLRTTVDINTASDPFTALPAHTTGEEVYAIGGYHDAGDYDKNINHLAVVDSLVDLYETNPDKFKSDELGLPESGNGIPDILDEALWAIEVYTVLQEDDGGVSGGIETTGYPGYDDMPEDDPYTVWYAYASDPKSSYIFAGAAAKLSRVLAAIDSDKAKEFLEYAESAFNWADEAQLDVTYDCSDKGSYAAAELLKTTGESKYDIAYQEYSVFKDGLDYYPADWDTVDTHPLWAYATADAADPTYKNASAALIISWASRLLVYAEETGYRRFKQHYCPISFGSGSTPAQSHLLFAAYELTGNEDFYKWLSYISDITLGANEEGISYVTGSGPHSVYYPLHTPSLADGIDAPVPGIVVYGPARYTSDSGILGAAISAYSPSISSWPICQRFADVSYVPEYNEFTITESIATTVLAFGFLSGLSSPSTNNSGKKTHF